jgi:BirA family biotin operon repressor/biotin-[acetyl-CoA-carboxylase] ligase
VVRNWTHRLQLAETPSTNELALHLLPHRPAEGTCISAIHQTAGKGQQGSTWLAPAGENLTLSIILYPTFLTGHNAFALSRATALAVRDVVLQFLTAAGQPDLPLQVKWPNDVLADNRKICGILIQTQWLHEQMQAAVVGIGLNVNQLEFDPSLVNRATSLAALTGRKFDSYRVEDTLLQLLESRYEALRLAPEAQTREYERHLLGYQQERLFYLPESQRTLAARVMGTTSDGRVTLQTPEDEILHLQPKQVEWV